MKQRKALVIDDDSETRLLRRYLEARRIEFSRTPPQAASAWG